MTRVVDVLVDLFGLPVTVAPGDALCRPHDTLESPAVVGCVVAVPGGDTARQEALLCICRSLGVLLVTSRIASAS